MPTEQGARDVLHSKGKRRAALLEVEHFQRREAREGRHEGSGADRAQLVGAAAGWWCGPATPRPQTQCPLGFSSSGSPLKTGQDVAACVPYSLYFNSFSLIFAPCLAPPTPSPLPFPTLFLPGHLRFRFCRAVSCPSGPASERLPSGPMLPPLRGACTYAASQNKKPMSTLCQLNSYHPLINREI